jgi:hypothetical protein
MQEQAPLSRGMVVQENADESAARGPTGSTPLAAQRDHPESHDLSAVVGWGAARGARGESRSAAGAFAGKRALALEEMPKWRNLTPRRL